MWFQQHKPIRNNQAWLDAMRALTIQKNGHFESSSWRISILPEWSRRNRFLPEILLELAFRLWIKLEEIQDGGQILMMSKSRFWLQLLMCSDPWIFPSKPFLKCMKIKKSCKSWYSMGKRLLQSMAQEEGYKITLLKKIIVPVFKRETKNAFLKPASGYILIAH